MKFISNFLMSKLRITAEWDFGRVAKYWAFCDYFANQKIYLQQLGKQYVMATILTNLITCFYSCAVAASFQVDPPSLLEYLATPALIN